MTGVTPAWMLSPNHPVSANVEIVPRLKLGIDVDGVLSNFSGRYAEFAKDLFDLDLQLANQTTWDFPGVSKHQDQEIWKRINTTLDFWMTLRPLPGANSLIEAQYRHDLFFITSRTPTKGYSPTIQTAKWLWMNRWVMFPTVLVVDHPTEKIPIAKSLNLNAFIDDKPSTVKQMREAGIHTFVLDQPYNKDVPDPRVPNVDEFILAVEAPTEVRWAI